MASHLQTCVKRQLVSHMPSFVADGLQYETIMGSEAYGVSADGSDLDIIGFCIPDKATIFPHLKGDIPGFGEKAELFEAWQQHHIHDANAMGGAGRTYDFSVYSIVKYFQLVMENNPNMIDSLWTPQRCITFMTPIGQLVRERRKLFLHKGLWPKFKGYSYAQLHKMRIKDPQPSSKRYESIQKHGYDVKFAYHVVRLLDECEQLLIEGDMDMERSREILKSIRRGEWTISEVEKYFQERETSLQETYNESKLPYAPDENAIREFLLDLLESHFGTLDGAVVRPERLSQALKEIEHIILRLKTSGDV